jgi:membrane-bound lytic murein transglycosylase D
MVLFLAFFFSISLQAKSPTNAEIIERVKNLNTIIDLKITDEVKEQVITLIEKRRRDAQSILGRTSLYFPLIENALREKGLPDELKYIAVVESSLIPNIESHQGASGIWQFMRPTAELYGLQVTKYVDERRDLVKSTDKALDYLKLLYSMYNDWTLALAAYNCGTGTINKAIKKAGGETNYWKISKHLPRETQKYIPRYIAVAYLMNYYFLHDLQPTEPSDDLKYTVSVRVKNKMNLKNLSKDLEVDLDLIRFLNPMYRKDVIPESKENAYTLTLPDIKMLSYFEKFGNSSDIVTSPYSYIRPDNIAIKDKTFSLENHPKFIAFLKNTVVRDNLKDSSFLNALAQGMNKKVYTEKLLLYRMKRKESLADISREKNIPLVELMAINDIDPEKGLAPGSLIKLSR